MAEEPSASRERGRCRRLERARAGMLLSTLLLLLRLLLLLLLLLLARLWPCVCPGSKVRRKYLVVG